MYFNVVSFIVTKKMKYIELVKVIFKLVNCTSFYPHLLQDTNEEDKASQRATLQDV